MTKRTAEEQAKLIATIELLYRHAQTIAAMPKHRHEEQFHVLRESLEEAGETLDLPTELTGGWISLLMKMIRTMVDDIEAGIGNAGGLH